jgi:hypothetical protein
MVAIPTLVLISGIDDSEVRPVIIRKRFRARQPDRHRDRAIRHAR